MIWIFNFIILFTAHSFHQEEQTVDVYNVEIEGGIEVYAKNSNVFPVTLELNIELENLSSSKRLPIILALDPKSDVKIINLKVKDTSKKWGLNSKYSYYMGDIFADHSDNYSYRLPYQLGTDAIVAQGYNGDFSHSGNVTYAIDFNLSEGTPIYAARSGVVVDLKESFSEGGAEEFFINKANYITIVHNDGTFSEYSHLRLNGANVNIGQSVRSGQMIGYSGSTGYATGPHLHFHVKKAVKGGEFVTIPVRFSTQKGSIQLKEGENYKAL